MMRCRRIGLLALSVALFPSLAHANAGTPLLWLSAFHLVVGNALLGIFEGMLLAKLFGAPKKRSVLLLVAANYASAWLGFPLLGLTPVVRFDVTIENIRWWLVGCTLLMFLVTLVIEFPFVLAALRKREKRVRKAITATLSIQAISYAVLVVLYVTASGAPMITRLKVIPPAEMGVPGGYSLYYVTADGDGVVRSDLSGENVESVCTLSSGGWWDRVFVRPRPEGGHDLFLRVESGEATLILENFAPAAAVERRIAEDPAAAAASTGANDGPVPQVGVEGAWQYRAMRETISGTTKDREDHQSFQYYVHTPFAMWNVRNAAHIAGDFAVFQLGPDQICILQPQEKRIALIARGKGPVVAMDRVAGE